jgi:Copper type II ascorbate-dependent monooxygenase, C-terminal domain
MKSLGLIGVLVSLVTVGCGDDGSGQMSTSNDAGRDGGSDAGSTPTHQSTAISSQSTAPDASAPNGPADGSASDAHVSPLDGGPDAGGPTYFGDVLPIFEANCLGCHVASSIGPFRLDVYSSAKAYASAIESATANRTMPPYLVNNDGTCGEFANAPYLTDAEIQTISDWVQAGAPEGTPRAVVLPAAEELTDPETLMTPEFTPAPGGGHLDEHDDYRCFLMDTPPIGEFGTVITGYKVQPGNAQIVHHVVVTLVDMAGPADYAPEDGGVVTNEMMIQQLDEADPEIEGWKCFGLAGDGVAVDSVPVVWAPGQGVVHFPDSSGIPVLPTQKLVVQVHYNLENSSHIGQSDSTEIQFQLAALPLVPNLGVYLPNDPLLNSLLSGGEPHVLPHGQASTKYIWENTFAELGLGSVPEFKLWGIFPHMHETGQKYTFEVKRAAAPDGDGGAPDPECKAQVNQWDFHWQHLYFYEQAELLTPADSVRITCDYDTTGKTEDVLPGWGTQNEMCFAGVFVTMQNPYFQD